METADELRKRADEAERQARSAKTEHDRGAYLRIAKGWRDLLNRVEGKWKKGF